MKIKICYSIYKTIKQEWNLHGFTLCYSCFFVSVFILRSFDGNWINEHKLEQLFESCLMLLNYNIRMWICYVIYLSSVMMHKWKHKLKETLRWIRSGFVGIFSINAEKWSFFNDFLWIRSYVNRIVQLTFKGDILMDIHYYFE